MGLGNFKSDKKSNSSTNVKWDRSEASRPTHCFIKNKSGDATDKHNYRPIAISTTMSKVLELLMQHKIDSYLYTTDNQFGFKQNHGTDMCIYALRQTIDYYKRNSSPVFICY